MRREANHQTADLTILWKYFVRQYYTHGRIHAQISVERAWKVLHHRPVHRLRPLPRLRTEQHQTGSPDRYFLRFQTTDHARGDCWRRGGGWRSVKTSFFHWSHQRDDRSFYFRYCNLPPQAAAATLSWGTDLIEAFVLSHDPSAK